jgi:transposase
VQRILGFKQKTKAPQSGMRQAARMILKHLSGILNVIVKGVMNAGAESINAKIQKIKRMACGCRNRKRFKNAIYFHCGGLEMELVALAHTES